MEKQKPTMEKAREVGNPRQEDEQGRPEEGYREGLGTQVGAQGLGDAKNDTCRALAARTLRQVWAAAIKPMRPARGRQGSKWGWKVLRGADALA